MHLLGKTRQILAKACQSRLVKLLLVLATIATTGFSCAPAAASRAPMDQIGGYSVYGAMPVGPLRWYAAAFAEAKDCLGHKGLNRDFEDLQWFLVDSIVPREELPKGKKVIGIYLEQRRAIFMVWQWRYDARLVIHEVMHYLRPGVDEDKDAAFVRCDPLGG